MASKNDSREKKDLRNARLREKRRTDSEWHQRQLARDTRSRLKCGDRKIMTMRGWLCSKLGSSRRPKTYAREHKPGRYLEVTITIDQLMDLYEIQDGKCAITGLVMTHQTKCPYGASIDRINSDGCYEISNIQLVCVAVNLAKHSLSDRSIREWFDAVRSVPLEKLG